MKQKRVARLRSLKQLDEYLQSGWFTRPSLDQIQPPKGIATALQWARALRSPIRLRTDLESRLKAFWYPYPEGRRSSSRITFYNKVKGVGLLTDLLDGELFWIVFLTLQLNDQNEIERSRRLAGSSEYGYPIRFHNEMLSELLTHARVINSLVTQYKIPRAWAETHLRSTDTQLARELAISKWYSPGARIGPRTLSSWGRDMQIEIFRAILSALQKHGIERGSRLATQLTSLICSPQACIVKGELDPSPEAIRRKVGSKFTKKP
jgi:hypothetical protein